MASNIVRAWNSKTIRHRADGYLSATDMAQANGKLIADWLRLKSTRAFLDKTSSVMGIPITDLIQVFQGGVGEEQGTWIHPDIAPDLGTWCSIPFRVQVNQWIKELLTKGMVSIANQDPRLLLLEQLTQLTHGQIALEERQKELVLENQRLRLEQQQIQAEQTIQGETIAQHDAELGRIFQPDGALISLAGCLNLHGRHATAAQLAPVGKAAAQVYRERYGKEPEKVGDARYGTVNVYPQVIATQALKDHGYLG